MEILPKPDEMKVQIFKIVREYEHRGVNLKELRGLMYSNSGNDQNGAELVSKLMEMKKDGHLVFKDKSGNNAEIPSDDTDIFIPKFPG